MCSKGCAFHILSVITVSGGSIMVSSGIKSVSHIPDIIVSAGTKAVSGKVAYWIFVLLILLPIMIFSIAKVMGGFSSQVTKIGDIENKLVEDRIFQILSFTDPNTGRGYPGMIYLPNFDESVLNGSIKTQRQFGLKLSLVDKAPIYFNQEFYEVAKPLKNLNKYQETKTNRYVLIIDGEGNITPSYFEISIMHYRENE